MALREVRSPILADLLQDLGFSRLARALSAYWERREARAAFRAMEELDDRLLDDVGVTRGDVEWATRLPLSVNAAVALRHRADARRRSQ